MTGRALVLRVALIVTLVVAGAIAVAITMAGGGTAGVNPLMGVGPVTMPLWCAFVITFLCGSVVTGVLATMLLPTDPRVAFGAFVYGVVIVVAAYVLHLAGISGLPFFRSLIVVALTLAGLIAAILAGRRFTSESGLEVRSRSGGLGGGLGGWRLSSAASFALLTVVLIGAAVATANIDRPPPPAKADTPPKTDNTPQASPSATVRLQLLPER